MVSCVFGGDSDDDYGTGLLQVGTVAPDFFIYTDDFPDGFALSSLRGKNVVLEFWASWCPDCQEATADMVDLYQSFGWDDMLFVGFSFDTDKDEWQSYIKDNEMDWIQCCELTPWKDSKVATAYNVKWIPTFYLIDKDGIVVFATVDISEMREELLNY
ncbi:MAG: TlpA family protein disulfide reductase [Prevotella sp.]|nr:TlpA family protein disulfide reductase [Prevotella sp.]